MDRRTTLEVAIRCVCHDRQDQHGKPENTFQYIADYWNTYLNHKGPLPLRGEDVAIMMNLFKVARSEMNPSNEDNYVDACGYMALASELVSAPPKEEVPYKSPMEVLEYGIKKEIEEPTP